MQVNLQATGLRDAIDLGTDDYREDRSALAVQGVHCRSMGGDPTNLDGGDRIEEVTADKLCHDFTNL
jgi:hypothetical protein